MITASAVPITTDKGMAKPQLNHLRGSSVGGIREYLYS